MDYKEMYHDQERRTAEKARQLEVAKEEILTLKKIIQELESFIESSAS